MPTCTTASSRTWWSNTNDLKCPPRCSGHLQRKYYFRFCKSGRAAAPPDLPFHGKGRSGQRHRGCCWPAAKTQREQVLLRDEPSQSRIRSTAPPKGGAYRAFGKKQKAPPSGKTFPGRGKMAKPKRGTAGKAARLCLRGFSPPPVPASCRTIFQRAGAAGAVADAHILPPPDQAPLL